MVWIKYISKALQILLYLVDRVNKEQICFPAVSIGRELHISISMVKRELVETGYVKSIFERAGEGSNLIPL